MTPGLRSTLRRAVAACAFALAQAAAALEPGAIAPEFVLPGSTGQTMSLSALHGKVVYVDFWASWCTPCRRSLPWLDGMVQRYGTRGLTAVAINVDQRRSDADRFLAQVPTRLPLAFDTAGTTAKQFDVKAMPTSFIIGRDGKVRAVHAGYRGSDAAAREAQLQKLLAEP